MECAEPYYPKFVYTYVVRSGYWQGYATRALDHYDTRNPNRQLGKFRHGARRSNKQTPKKKKKSVIPAHVTNDLSEEIANGLKRQAEADEEAERKRKRRNPYALLYNPNNHIRRREMTEITNLQKCQGCEKEFRTISLLERHIPVCSQKDRIKEFHESTPPSPEPEEEEDPWDPTKHMCIYCEKLFTYLGMLRKHIFDTCPVRADYVEKGEYIDEEWEQDITARANAKQETWKDTPNKLSNDDDNNSDSLQSDMRGRKRKRRSNNWGYKPKTNSPLPRPGENGENLPFFGYGDSSNSSDAFSSRKGSSSDSNTRNSLDKKDGTNGKIEINFANRFTKAKSVDSVKKDIKSELDNGEVYSDKAKLTKAGKLKNEIADSAKSNTKEPKTAKPNDSKFSTKISAANPLLAQSILKPPVVNNVTKGKPAENTPTVKAQLAKKIKEGKTAAVTAQNKTTNAAESKKRKSSKVVSKKVKVTIAKKTGKAGQSKATAVVAKKTKTAAAAVVANAAAAKKVVKKVTKTKVATAKQGVTGDNNPQDNAPVRKKPGPKPGSKRKKTGLEMICLTKSKATKAVSALMDTTIEHNSDIENTDIKAQKQTTAKKKKAKSQSKSKKPTGMAVPATDTQATGVKLLVSPKTTKGKAVTTTKTTGKTMATTKPKGKPAPKQQPIVNSKTILAKPSAKSSPKPDTTVAPKSSAKSKSGNSKAKAPVKAATTKAAMSKTSNKTAVPSDNVSVNKNISGAKGKAVKSSPTVKKDTPDKTKKDTSDKSKKDTNYKTKKDTLDKTKKDTSDKTKKDTPDKTMKDALDKTKKDITDKTKKDMLDKTKKDTPDKTKKDASDKAKKDASDKAKKDISDKTKKGGQTGDQGENKPKETSKSKASVTKTANKRKLETDSTEDSPNIDIPTNPPRRARRETTPTLTKSATPSPVRNRKCELPTSPKLPPSSQVYSQSKVVTLTKTINPKRGASPTKTTTQWSPSAPAKATTTVIKVTSPSKAPPQKKSTSPLRQISPAKSAPAAKSVSTAVEKRASSPEKATKGAAKKDTIKAEKQAAKNQKGTTAKQSNVSARRKAEAEPSEKKCEKLEKAKNDSAKNLVVSTEEKIKKALKTLKEVLSTDDSETDAEDMGMGNEDYEDESDLQDMEMPPEITDDDSDTLTS